MMVDPIQKKGTSGKHKNKSNGGEWREFKRKNQGTTENKRGGVDVLLYMVVTAAVFHLEMSALNAVA